MDNRAKTSFRPLPSDSAAIDLLQKHIEAETGVRPSMAALLRMGIVALVKQYGLKLPSTKPTARPRGSKPPARG